MCTSYEANTNDSRWDVFSLFPRADFDYKRVIYRDYFFMKSRFTQVALTRSSGKTVREIIAGSVHNTNQIAKILAKSRSTAK